MGLLLPESGNVLIRRNEKLDQNKKRVFIGISWIAYALILLMGGMGGGSSSAKTDTASAPKQTQAPAVQQTTPAAQTKTVWQEKDT